MNAEKFSESLNQINDKYIEEAAGFRAAPKSAPAPQMAPIQNASAPKQPRSSKGLKVWRAIAIAACAVLVVGVAAAAIGLSSGSKNSSGNGGALTPDVPAGGYYENSNDADMYDGNEEYYTGDYSIKDEAAMTEPGLNESTSEGSAPAPGTGSPYSYPANENAKIIYTAQMSVQTTSFTDSQKAIEEATTKHGGYFENMDISDADTSYRSAYYRIRVPAEELDAFLKESSAFGTVTSSSRTAEDVSEYYYDTESRLESAKAKLARLQELYSQAQNMTDIITIETQISNVQWEIDSLSGELKHYDSQVDYSTVTVNLSEVYNVNTGSAPLSFGERISKGFRDGLTGFASAMEDLLVWLAESWIWILLVVIVLGAAIIVLVKVEKKHRKPRD